jgi:hypothetical protein
MEIGLKDFAETVLTFREEVYIVRVMGEVVDDEEGRSVYKIELCFPELPNVRRIKFLPTADGCYKMRLEELPNQNLAKAFVDSFPTQNALLNGILERRLGDGYLHRLLKDVFAPSLLAIPTEKENAMQLLEQEEKSRAARRRSVSFITSIVSRFFEESAEGTEKKSILPDFISRFIPQKKRPEKEERIATKSPALPARDEKSNLPMAEAAKAEVSAIVALMESAEGAPKKEDLPQDDTDSENT